MKNLMILAALAFSLYACTGEDNLVHPNQDTDAASNASYKKDNALNPNDTVGALFGLLYENYSPGAAGTAFTESLATQVLAFAMQYEGFAQLAGGGVPAPDHNLAQSFQDTTTQNLEAALQATGLGPQGTTSLGGLANTLEGLSASGAGYDSAHEAILAYELGIGADTTLTAGDTALLYTTTAILRYELDVQRRKKPKDRDWEMSVGHIAATAYGASESDAEAILYGLITSYP